MVGLKAAVWAEVRMARAPFAVESCSFPCPLLCVAAHCTLLCCPFCRKMPQPGVEAFGILMMTVGACWVGQDGDEVGQSRDGG